MDKPKSAMERSRSRALSRKYRVPRCVYCGGPRPRTVVLGGYAHKRCIPK